ncbi:succinyldiaminopimelate transaminase [Corynebacterium sp. sy017]|uniref:succinyldiaminopimelate transaminase n=1 Tax=unclassified Corynebacterium TaxID=2624378 RepID=UPI001185CC80|nr:MULTISPECIES: succinyldiaminopimelate transaminase [unclassified Corynebacterium]MBP3088949.1 succinyldiaminopimelate transaminase [Corynebacterium sp. sy017]TSD91275.1 succinyldiaminopimelate transaminase [Corynebacterium sp. SY003]
MARTQLGSLLPDFPWNSLEPIKAQAQAHPDGLINLSVGSPIDEVAPGIQLALSQAAAAPGYPQTIGTPQLRQSIIKALERRFHCPQVKGVLPVIGTKEAIALLPTLLGIRGHVLIPRIAYPTYEVAVLMAGATPVRCDDPSELPEDIARDVDLIFINSPANPTGEIIALNKLQQLIAWAREHNAIIASDECYLGLVWEGEAFSVLDERVCAGNHDNILAIHSLSKTSNLAAYRAGFFAGDEQLIAELTEVRKHAGLMMPGPNQAAMAAALDDDLQEQLQKMRYQKRREALLEALTQAGFRIEHSEAGLYLWATRDENCWDTVRWFAQHGIVVAPGSFYGEQAENFVRIALTGSDEDIAQVVQRLGS